MFNDKEQLWYYFRMKNILWVLFILVTLTTSALALTANLTDGTMVDVSLDDGTTTDIGDVKVSYVIEQTANNDTKGYLYIPEQDKDQPGSWGVADIQQGNDTTGTTGTTVKPVFDWTFWAALGCIIIIMYGIYWYKKRKKKKEEAELLKRDNNVYKEW